MSYFVTGATGFVGRYLVSKLLQRKGTAASNKIYVLLRKNSQKKFDAIASKMGWDMKRVLVVHGDMTSARCGVSAAQLKALTGKVKHFFHLAAIYDLTAKPEAQYAANVEGTQNALDLAAAIGAGIFHHTSSIAAAGLYPGVFREDMFEEAEGLDDPYLRTKHDSEGLVRRETRLKWRIYRPGMVVGHSQTGEMDKIDGPYYFFTFLKKLREMLPPWMPTLGIEGGRINVVPVDFVVDAMDHIAHKPKLDGHCFHLVDPEPQRVGEVLNTFARAGHAPEMTMRIDARMFAFVPGGIRMAVGARGSAVLTQFLVESVVMSVLGGVIGLLVGFGGAALLGRLTGWSTTTPPEAVFMAVGFSAAVGIFFGYYPARRAAQMNPIDALRYE